MPSYDEDLERAIALSLVEANAPVVIDLAGDSDGEDPDTAFDADLRHALNASKAETSATATARARGPPDADSTGTRSASATPDAPGLPAPPPTVPAPAAGASMFLSERAQLERARIERQKRARRAAGLDEDSDHNGEGEGEDAGAPPAKRQHLSSPSRARADGAPAAASRSAPAVPAIEQLFWDGELRPTATRHGEPRRDGGATFRLTDIIGKKSELAFAVISSYALMLSWIYEFFERGVPVVLVAQPDASGKQSMHNVLPDWIKTTPRLVGGRGCMHMKFMLLFYKTGRLRVVVSTANLVDFDYRDIENAVWLQDIPLRPSPIAHDPKATDDFAAVLQRVLHATNVAPALTTFLKSDHPDLPLQSIDELRTRWDWSKVRAQLVPSIAGRHDGWPKVILTGHPRLMKAVRSIGMRTGKVPTKELVLECQGSSIGQYTTQWLNEFYYSARGESAEDWLDVPAARRAKAPWPPVKIVFPTAVTVRASALGEAGGGTIFCRNRQWTAAKFPRALFHDSRSKGGPVLMHTKMIIATLRDAPAASRRAAAGSDTEDDDDDAVEVIEPGVGWAYVGSHNFTPSAWGTLSGSAFGPVLNITNYELGVLVPLRDAAEAERIACFERPAPRYAADERPWMQEESEFHQEQA